MGYYTTYTLTIHSDPEGQYDEVEKYFNSSEHEGKYWHRILDGDCDSMKWYDHDEDMLAISELFPNVVFELHGDGDLWYKYYKGGKMQRCKASITFEPYDESKLKYQYDDPTK